MEKKKVIGSVLLTAGAYIAFGIGAGFATGQETLQYFGSQGPKAFATLLVCCICACIINTEYFATGYREQFANKNGVYSYYAGPYLGKIFDIITQIAVYSCFVMMVSGAGASLQQYYGVPQWVGTVGMTVLAGGTVIMGLRRISDIIGRIGPMIIFVVLAICIPSIFKGSNTIAEGMQMTQDMHMVKISESWLLTAFNYLGMTVLWSISFLPLLGKSLKYKEEAKYSMPIGTLVYYLTAAIVTMALFANINKAAVAEVPLLVLANDLSPLIGSIVSIIVLLGIYSSAVPLLYSPIVRFVDDSTKQGKCALLAAAVVAAVIALFVPYSMVVNIVMSVGGYAGLVLLALTVIRVVIRLVSAKEAVTE